IVMQNRLSLAIQDAEEHRSSVQIDAAGELVRPGVDSHAVPPLEGLLTTLNATAWVDPGEACMSFNSFERTCPLPCGSLRSNWFVGHAAQLEIR
ncbi:MAG: hypothetical protein ACREA0_30620, partial [bacterium]